MDDLGDRTVKQENEFEVSLSDPLSHNGDTNNTTVKEEVVTPSAKDVAGETAMGQGPLQKPSAVPLNQPPNQNGALKREKLGSAAKRVLKKQRLNQSLQYPIPALGALRYWDVKRVYLQRLENMLVGVNLNLVRLILRDSGYITMVWRDPTTWEGITEGAKVPVQSDGTHPAENMYSLLSTYVSHLGTWPTLAQCMGPSANILRYASMHDLASDPASKANQSDLAEKDVHTVRYQPEGMPEEASDWLEVTCDSVNRQWLFLDEDGRPVFGVAVVARPREAVVDSIGAVRDPMSLRAQPMWVHCTHSEINRAKAIKDLIKIMPIITPKYDGGRCKDQPFILDIGYDYNDIGDGESIDESPVDLCDINYPCARVIQAGLAEVYRYACMHFPPNVTQQMREYVAEGAKLEGLRSKNDDSAGVNGKNNSRSVGLTGVAMQNPEVCSSPLGAIQGADYVFGYAISQHIQPPQSAPGSRSVSVFRLPHWGIHLSVPTSLNFNVVFFHRSHEIVRYSRSGPTDLYCLLFVGVPVHGRVGCWRERRLAGDDPSSDGLQETGNIATS